MLIPKQKMNTIKNITLNNICWIIGALISVGIFVGIVKSQGQDITEIQRFVNESTKKHEQIDMQLQKVDFILSDIKEIKTDIKEIKRIIYIPIVKQVTQDVRTNKTNSL